MNRRFSESFKKEKVGEINRNRLSIAKVCDEYGISTTTVYRWLARYSPNYEKGVRMVVESDSDTHKLAELRSRIEELERAVGQKQMLIDFQGKMIEMAEQEYRVDIKKKFAIKPSSGIGQTVTTTR
jgi:transposase-like protein